MNSRRRVVPVEGSIGGVCVAGFLLGELSEMVGECLVGSWMVPWEDWLFLGSRAVGITNASWLACGSISSVGVSA